MARPQSSATTPHAPISPIAPPAVHAMATPVPPLVDASLPGYLIPAAMTVLADSTAASIRRQLALEREAQGGESAPNSHETPDKGRVGDEDVPRLVEEGVSTRLERMGLMVGGYVAEKLIVARPPISTHLDMIKFICKDLFLHVYGKQIDNLRTNHRGIFVLQSNIFPPLAPLSTCRGSAADLESARAYLVFPQALIQGALGRLGMNATVVAESASLPQCTFQIRTVTKTAPAPVGRPESLVAPDSARFQP